MRKHIDNANHCRHCGLFIQTDFQHKRNKFDNDLTITGEKTKSAKCKLICINTENDHPLKTEEHKNFSGEQQSGIRVNCNSCDRTVWRKFWQNYENSFRHKGNIKNQSKISTQCISSSQRARNNNNKKICDIRNMWTFRSNTTHDNTKTNKSKVIEKHEGNPFALLQNNSKIS